MEPYTIRDIITNLRDPLNARNHVKFTARSIRFLSLYFQDLALDLITIHTILLRLAASAGCLEDRENVIKLPQVLIFLASREDTDLPLLKKVASSFSIENDSSYHEVEEMLKVLSYVK